MTKNIPESNSKQKGKINKTILDLVGGDLRFCWEIDIFTEVRHFSRCTLGDGTALRVYN